MNIIMESDNKFIIHINYNEMETIYYALCDKAISTIRKDIPDYYQARFECIDEMLNIFRTQIY